MGTWGWAHLYADTRGITAQYSEWTFGSYDEVRASLQAHLDSHPAREAAATQVRALSAYPGPASAHSPGHTWRIHDGRDRICVFVGDAHEAPRLVTFERPAAPAGAPAATGSVRADGSGPPPVKVIVNPGYLLVFRLLAVVAGIALLTDGHVLSGVLFVLGGLLGFVVPAAIKNARKG